MRLTSESQARAWIESSFDVPRETMEQLDAFAAIVREENQRQNLVSAATLDQLWIRHVADSAQLLRFSSVHGEWLDAGTGAGFPGLVIALLRPEPTLLVEQRRLRAEFLDGMVQRLGIAGRCSVLQAKVEAVPSRICAVLSARAFAPLDRLLPLLERFAAPETLWLLPKGRSAQTELERVESSWQGEFRLEPSVTDAEARIIVARNVRRRGKGKKGR